MFITAVVKVQQSMCKCFPMSLDILSCKKTWFLECFVQQKKCNISRCHASQRLKQLRLESYMTDV